MIGWILGVALASDLEGSWRLEMSVRSEAVVPVIKNTVSTTVTLGLVTVRNEAGVLVHRQQVCAVDMRDRNPLAKTTLSDALIASLPITTARIVTTDGGYAVDLGTSHLGYDPARTSILPVDPTDPAVIDAEGDGRPGATVLLTVAGVGRYGIDVVQRSHAVLDGRVTDDGVSGTVRTLDFAQEVLDADASWLETAPVVTHDDARSTFTMTRVDAGTTCADLRER